MHARTGERSPSVGGRRPQRESCAGQDERASDVRELGFALLLAPNAIAALGELGVADAVVAATATPTSGDVLRTDGRLLRRVDAADSRIAIGGVPRVALRTVLHSTLLETWVPERYVCGLRVMQLNGCS